MFSALFQLPCIFRKERADDPILVCKNPLIRKKINGKIIPRLLSEHIRPIRMIVLVKHIFILNIEILQKKLRNGKAKLLIIPVDLHMSEFIIHHTQNGGGGHFLSLHIFLALCIHAKGQFTQKIIAGIKGHI